MGFCKVEKPTVLKELVRPAMIVIATTTDPFAFATLTHDAAQATTNPLIQAGERPFVTMLEILKPSSEHIYSDQR